MHINFHAIWICHKVKSYLRNIKYVSHFITSYLYNMFNIQIIFFFRILKSQITFKQWLDSLNFREIPLFFCGIWLSWHLLVTLLSLYSYIYRPRFNITRCIIWVHIVVGRINKMIVHGSKNLIQTKYFVNIYKILTEHTWLKWIYKNGKFVRLRVVHFDPVNMEHSSRSWTDLYILRGII